MCRVGSPVVYPFLEGSETTIGGSFSDLRNHIIVIKQGAQVTVGGNMLQPNSIIIVEADAQLLVRGEFESYRVINAGVVENPITTASRRRTLPSVAM